MMDYNLCFRTNPDRPAGEVELVHTNLEEGDSLFDLGDVDVFGLDRNAGSNPCADSNGGCEDLCLFSGAKGPFTQDFELLSLSHSSNLSVPMTLVVADLRVA